MFEMLELRARALARRGLAGAIGGLLAAVGLGFLTHAAWLALVDWRDPLFAAQTLGGVYVLLGGLVLLGARRRPEARRTSPPPQAVNPVMLVEAFLLGLDAARGTQRRTE